MDEKEFIEREAAISCLEKLERNSHHNSVLWPDHVEECREALRGIPAADVRPVVLCRDCKYCRRVDEFEYWCDGFCSPARLVRKDDFCSHGKAKE